MQESGLAEAELRSCRLAAAIPTGRIQPSMNLSHAVSVVLAELFQRSLGLASYSSFDEPHLSLASATAHEPHDSSSNFCQTGVSTNTLSVVDQGLGGVEASELRIGTGAGKQPVPYGRPLGHTSLPATNSELEALMKKFAAIAEAAGER